MGQPPKGEEITTEVNNLRKMVVEAVISQGKYNIRIDATLQQRAQTLSHRKLDGTYLVGEDHLWDHEYYLSQHGDYETNFG